MAKEAPCRPDRQVYRLIFRSEQHARSSFFDKLLLFQPLFLLDNSDWNKTFLDSVQFSVFYTL
jgi:hypothetical protein